MRVVQQRVVRGTRETCSTAPSAPLGPAGNGFFRMYFTPFVTDCTSSITTQICLTHWIIASGVPEIVTARSVELGSMSPATCT